MPLRDVFAAFFFLNFGLALDIAQFGSVIGVVLVAIVMTFVLSLGTGALLAWLHKMGRREALNTAAIFVNRGEFTLILATLSVGAGLDPRLQPFAGLYVLSMAILGPLFTANSEKIGAFLSASTTSPRPRRPRNPMLDEEIALVEAATREPDRSGRDRDSMLDFVTERAERPVTLPDPPRSDTHHPAPLDTPDREARPGDYS